MILRSNIFGLQPLVVLLEIPGAAWDLNSRVEDVESVREPGGIDPIRGGLEKVEVQRVHVCSLVFSSRGTDRAVAHLSVTEQLWIKKLWTLQENFCVLLSRH